MSNKQARKRRKSNLLLPAAALAGLLLLRRTDSFDKLASIIGAGAGGEGDEGVDDGLLQQARPQVLLDPELYSVEQPAAEAAQETTPEAPAPSPGSSITSPSRQPPAPSPTPSPPPTPPSRDISLRRELASGAAFAAGAIAAERAAKAVSRRIRMRAKTPSEKAESRVWLREAPTPKVAPRVRAEHREKAPATKVERLSVRRLAKRVREVLKPSKVSRIVQTSLREFPKGAETAIVLTKITPIAESLRKVFKRLPAIRWGRGGAV